MHHGFCLTQCTAKAPCDIFPQQSQRQRYYDCFWQTIYYLLPFWEDNPVKKSLDKLTSDKEFKDYHIPIFSIALCFFFFFLLTYNQSLCCYSNICTHNQFYLVNFYYLYFIYHLWLLRVTLTIWEIKRRREAYYRERVNLI